MNFDRYFFSSFLQRLKASLTHQVSSVNGGCGMVVGTASTMVTARPEQSQILIQHPDAPSPAQPQVSTAVGWEESAVILLPFMTCLFFYRGHKIKE